MIHREQRQPTRPSCVAGKPTTCTRRQATLRSSGLTPGPSCVVFNAGIAGVPGGLKGRPPGRCNNARSEKQQGGTSNA